MYIETEKETENIANIKDAKITKQNRHPVLMMGDKYTLWNEMMVDGFMFYACE